MRFIVFILALLISADGISQTDWGVPSPHNGNFTLYPTARKVIMTSASGNGVWDQWQSSTGQSLDNFPIPFLYYKAKDVSKKQPAIIHLHGIGERGGSAGNTHNDFFDTTFAIGTGQGSQWLDDNYQLPPMNNLQQTNGSATEMELVGKKVWIPGTVSDSSEFHFFAPQQWGDGSSATGTVAGSYNDFGFDKWPPIYIKQIIKEIKTNSAYYSVIDTNRIYLAGHSLGGGGVITALTDSVILHQIAGALIVCPGYRTSAVQTATSDDAAITTAEYQMIARSGVPIWVFHEEDDNDASISQSTSFINSLNAQSPIFPPKFTRFAAGEMVEKGLTSNPDHSIWHPVFRPTWHQAADTYTTTYNGEVQFTRNGGKDWLSPYEWLLQFSTNHNRKPSSGAIRR